MAEKWMEIIKKEMEKIEDEYDGMYKGTLKKMYLKYADKPYSFL